MATGSEDSLQRLQQAMETLNRIGAEAGSVDALMRRIVDEAMRFCDATGAVVEQAEGDALAMPGLRLAVPVSIGIALYKGPGSDRSSWLARADAAMYGAKKAGPNRYMLHGDDAAQAVG